MIRISKHTTKFLNKNKFEKLIKFLDEYYKTIQYYIDFLWNNEIVYNNKILNIKNQQYDCPKMLLAKVNNNLQTTLSARALKCCSTQACSVVRAVLRKPQSRQYIYNKLLLENKDVSKLEKIIQKQKITKPNIQDLKAELNSICCDFIFTKNSFDGFLQLKFLGKEFEKIRIPIKFHRQSLKWQSQGKMMKSFLISKDCIEIRWKIPDKEKIVDGEVVGVDQGMKDVVTLSTGVTTPKTDRHGHSLESIMKKMSIKKKGSKSFKKAQEHRKNFINYSINRINLKNIKQINLEEIINIRYKRNSSRLMSHWTNTLIRDKLVKKCKEAGVQIVLQSSAYRSQRCFICGWVQRTNRKGKEFCCKRCQHQIDADLNAARNHSIKLPDIPKSLRIQKLNRKGFYWKPSGFENLNGEELTVSLSQKIG